MQQLVLIVQHMLRKLATSQLDNTKHSREMKIETDININPKCKDFFPFTVLIFQSPSTSKRIGLLKPCTRPKKGYTSSHPHIFIHFFLTKSVDVEKLFKQNKTYTLTLVSKCPRRT